MPATTTKSDKGVAVKDSSKQSASERNARLKAVELAVEQIERQFGAGSIMK